MNKKIVIGIPVIGNNELLSATLKDTVSKILDKENTKIVIIDNASKSKYLLNSFLKKNKISIIRNNKNLGYFYPLEQLKERYKNADVIGLMHHDVILLENGWDDKVRRCFIDDKKLGLLGIFGWQKVNHKGSESDPVGNNADADSYQVYPFKRVTWTESVATVDSIAMFFDRDSIDLLEIDENIMLKHFYDKIWPMRLRKWGKSVKICGIPFLHFSNTKVISEELAQSFCIWFKHRWNREIPLNMVDDLVYFEGLIRFVHEFRDVHHMLPISVK